MHMSDEEGVDLPKVEAIRETPKALLCRIPLKQKGKETIREVWVPKSAIHDDSEVYDGHDNNHGKLVLHQWFAEKEGLT
jgi:hypothetical protein